MVDDEEKTKNPKFFFFIIVCFITSSVCKSSGGRGTREHGEKERRRDRQTERESFVASGGF